MLLSTKIASALIYPLGLFFIISLAAFASWVAGRKRAGMFALVAAVLMLWTASIPVFSRWLISTLEMSYPPVAIDDTPAADVAILLGGATEPKLPPRQYLELTRSADRILHAANLFRAGKVRAIIACGG
jgi:vancomycin permeability regulator SanA